DFPSSQRRTKQPTCQSSRSIQNEVMKQVGLWSALEQNKASLPGVRTNSPTCIRYADAEPDKPDDADQLSRKVSKELDIKEGRLLIEGALTPINGNRTLL